MPWFALYVVPILISLAVAAAFTVATMILFPKQIPQPPKRPDEQAPTDGTFNEKQTVPPLRVIAGRCRVGGDYATLEEKAGDAYHVIVHAAHRIEGYVQHWLHDELVTLESHHVVDPEHFGVGLVRIDERTGLDAETAWANLISVLPAIWTVDHRGDGLAHIHMKVRSVDSQSFATVYPQGMPVHTALVDGAWVYDPRDEYQSINNSHTWAFSRNLALIRLFHLTHPSGGRLDIRSDIYMPDWEFAADVCDDLVTNRDEIEEPRYWGGLSWKYRADGEDAVSIGAKLDQAGELVPYTRGDGLIGVHAGVLETPDVRLTADDMLSLRYDANQSLASTVLATRGRFIDPRNSWMPSDAAIFGDPYAGTDETQRTQTVDNSAVQSHNHIQRLQKLAYIRANAPRVSIVIGYDDEKAAVMESRFVTVDYPSRGLDNATVEILDGTRLSLANLTISFEGIVVPDDLYSFDAIYEEGIPGGIVGKVEASGVPVPTGFAVAWLNDSAGYYGRATWDHVDDTFSYELMFQKADATEPPHSTMSNPGEVAQRTPVLPNVAHRFRLRTWSAGAPSDWTAWLAPGTGGGSDGDTVPPDDPTGLTAAFSGVTNTINGFWTNGAAVNLHHTEVYRAEVGEAFDLAVLIATNTDATPSGTPTFSDPEFGRMTGDYWLIAYNGSGLAGGLVGPVSAT